MTVNAPAGATLTFSVACTSPADDYDITLKGPDGKPIGMGAVFPEGTGDPSTGESANPGCMESITVKNAPSGELHGDGHRLRHRARHVRRHAEALVTAKKPGPPGPGFCRPRGSDYCTMKSSTISRALVVVVLHRRRLHEVRRRAEQRAADAAVHGDLGAAHARR